MRCAYCALYVLINVYSYGQSRPMPLPFSIVTEINCEIIVSGNVLVGSISKLPYRRFTQLAEFRFRRHCRGQYASVTGIGIAYVSMERAHGVPRSIYSQGRYTVVVEVELKTLAASGI